MKRDEVSLRRRHIIIAGVLSAAAPGTVFASQCGVVDGTRAADAYEGSFQGSGELLVSGRVVGADCKPVADALVELPPPRSGGDGIAVRTDGDGRFMLVTMLPARTDAKYLNYRVSHPEHGTRAARLHFARRLGIPSDAVTQLQRDDAGVWRATFGVSLV